MPKIRTASHTAAKTEGAFVLYVGGPTAPWEATARIFEQRYPGIKVSIIGGFSNVLDKKIDQQIKDGKLGLSAAPARHAMCSLHSFEKRARRQSAQPCANLAPSASCCETRTRFQVPDLGQPVDRSLRDSADQIGARPSPKTRSPNVAAACSCLRDGDSHGVKSELAQSPSPERRQNTQPSGCYQDLRAPGASASERVTSSLSPACKASIRRPNTLVHDPRGPHSSGIPQCQVDCPVGRAQACRIACGSPYTSATCIVTRPWSTRRRQSSGASRPIHPAR